MENGKWKMENGKYFKRHPSEMHQQDSLAEAKSVKNANAQHAIHKKE
ncbi:MAG: hypothetical protein ACRC6S_13015 [Shewanella sp.]